MTATVYYPFHPLHGRELRVTSRPRNPVLPVTVVDEAGSVLRIPAWMLAPEAVHYQLAAQATLDANLRALAALLMSLLDDGRAGGEGLSKTWEESVRGGLPECLMASVLVSGWPSSAKGRSC